MSVEYQHRDYVKNVKKWEMVRDADEGATAIKSRTKGTGTTGTLYGMKGTRYLPPPNASDLSDDNKLRYQAYVERATFVNFTAQTKEGMLGMVFRKQTTFELDTNIEYMIEDINGAGLTADQMTKDIAGEVLMVGRTGLLVDYPEADPNLTQAQVDAQNLRANILPYEAEAIINWRTDNYGGVQKLSLVVLQENKECEGEDEFEREVKPQYRVLRLEDGVYAQNVYDEGGNLLAFEGENGMEANIIPRKSDGSTFDEIPFIFVGSTNNDPSVDKAPLYDIAELNIAHYRNSADFEESSFMTGQPTPALAGLTQSWVDTNFPKGVHMGSRAAILLPDGGSASLLQANPNQMPELGMANKEKQLVKVGARLIMDQGGVETAEAAKIRFAGQNSKIANVISNVESGLITCFNWAVEFMGGTQEPEVEINKELYDKTIDPQMIIAQIQLLDRTIIAKKDIRGNLRKGNLIDAMRTDEEIDAEAETDSNSIGLL